MTLDQILAGPRPGQGDPEGDRAWLRGRALVQRLTLGGEFDPRRIFNKSTEEVRAWKVARRAWLETQLASRDRPAE